MDLVTVANREVRRRLITYHRPGDEVISLFPIRGGWTWDQILDVNNDNETYVVSIHPDLC